VIDTHCHFDVAAFDPDRDAALQRAFEAGVRGMVIPGIGPPNWEALLAWPRLEGPLQVQVALGIHPQWLPSSPESEDEATLERLESLLARGGAIAVGECGLDGPSISGAPMERQVKVLRRHFALARKYELPVLLHCFRVQPSLVQFFQEEPPPPRGVLLHSYSGGADLAKVYLRYGCHFSFAGPVSFLEARKPLDALRAIPRSRLMAETDAPDQAPHPHRGGRSEPAYLPLIVHAMADALKVPRGEFEEQTTENARAFFGCF